MRSSIMRFAAAMGEPPFSVCMTDTLAYVPISSLKCSLSSPRMREKAPQSRSPHVGPGVCCVIHLESAFAAHYSEQMCSYPGASACESVSSMRLRCIPRGRNSPIVPARSCWQHWQPAITLNRICHCVPKNSAGQPCMRVGINCERCAPSKSSGAPCLLYDVVFKRKDFKRAQALP